MSGLKVKQLEKKELKDLQSSKLTLLIEGKDTSPAFINSIRRAALLYVPTYVFAEKDINIEKNSELYTNDMIRLKISQIIIPNLDNPITSYDEVYYAQKNNETHEKQKDIYITINVTNDTDELMNVTTNDIHYYEDNERKDIFKRKYPYFLLKLRPGEEFRCNARASLGVGIVNDIYAAVSNSYYTYDKEEDHKYIFVMESQGQMDEYEIIDRVTGIMIEKLLRVKHTLKRDYDNAEAKKLKKFILELEEEDFTLGCILNYHLQSHTKLMSTIKKPDLLENKIVISVILQDSKSSILPSMYETIDHVINIYNDLNKQISKLGAKYITKH